MQFKGVPVFVAGDVMLDHYIMGDAGRMSPEAPVPVVQKKAAWSVPGGAANVARGLAWLGCRPSLVGLAGNDTPGQTLRTQIAAEGIKESLVISGARPTTCKTRIIAQGQQLLRVDEESARAPESEEESILRRESRKFMDEARAVVLSDYAKGTLLSDNKGDNLCSFLIEAGIQLGIPILVDPKGIDWDRYRGASCITPNTSEFIQICSSLGLWKKKAEPGARERRTLAEELCGRYEIGHLLLTRGARGMTLYEPGRAPENIRAAMREVADVSGAGDTVIATLAACVAGGMSWHEAAKMANAAAGIAVTKIGASPVSIAELIGAHEQEEPAILGLSELIDKLRCWRNAGQRIVFTNGCFDLLHSGHISLLRQCANLGDRVIVGLNTDASVKGLKGGERPVQDESSRARILAALKYVDAVTLFNEPTPENLIRLVRPDVLVKGRDYKIEEVAGAEFVQSYGGEVVLADLAAGCSTTDMIRRIKGK